MQLSHHVPGVAAWLRTVEGVTISPTLDPVQFRLRESHSTLANHIEEVPGPFLLCLDSHLACHTVIQETSQTWIPMGGRVKGPLCKRMIPPTGGGVISENPLSEGHSFCINISWITGGETKKGGVRKLWF